MDKTGYPILDATIRRPRYCVNELYHEEMLPQDTGGEVYPVWTYCYSDGTYETVTVL